MSRLPIVGSDTGTWGTVLNDYLAVGHNTDGTNKSKVWEIPPEMSDEGLQYAIDKCLTEYPGFYKGVLLSPGDYIINSPVILKSVPLVSVIPGSVRFVWAGAVGGTTCQQASWNIAGNASFSKLEGIIFTHSGNNPRYHIDWTAGWNRGYIDKYNIMRDCWFLGSSEAAINLGGYANVHWQDLRWDGCAGYCIQVTPIGGMNAPSFVLDRFTSDCNGIGFFHQDNTYNDNNIGNTTVRSGRLETNHEPLNSDHKARVFTYTCPDVSPAETAWLPILEDVELTVANNAWAGCLLYRNTNHTGNSHVMISVVRLRTEAPWVTFAGTLAGAPYPQVNPIIRNKVSSFDSWYGLYPTANESSNVIGDGGVITHYCASTPVSVQVTPTIAGTIATVSAISSTTFTVQLKNAAGASAASQTVYWRAAS